MPGTKHISDWGNGCDSTFFKELPHSPTNWQKQIMLQTRLFSLKHYLKFMYEPWNITLQYYNCVYRECGDNYPHTYIMSIILPNN